MTATPQDLLKEQYSALEETRADLVALYFVADPYLAEIGLVAADEQQAIVQTEYEAYARNALVQLRRVREGTRSSRKTTCATARRSCTGCWPTPVRSTCAAATRRPTYVVTDTARSGRRGRAAGRSAAHQVGGRLRGGQGAVRDLRRALRPGVRDEVVARVDHLKLPSYTGFVMPKLEPVHGPDGTIMDVRISYPCDLTTQMLEYSRVVTGTVP